MEHSYTFSSQITFLYCKDFEGGKNFMSQVLKLKPVYDPGWAAVYSVSEAAYIGVADDSRASLRFKSKGGTLISLTTDDIEKWHCHISEKLNGDVSPIKEIPDIGLKSFFFAGPEGYNFEVQQFLRPELKSMF